MKNKIWIYVLVGILALGIGFFFGKMVKKKKEEKESEDTDGGKSQAQRKIIGVDGKTKIVDSSYQLKDGETEIPRVNI